jgi:hypothetical protein
MNYVLLVDRTNDYEPPAPFGPFRTMGDAQQFAEEFREANGLPIKATPENNEAWTEAEWYFGIFLLRNRVENWNRSGLSS